VRPPKPVSPVKPYFDGKALLHGPTGRSDPEARKHEPVGDFAIGNMAVWSDPGDTHDVPPAHPYTLPPGWTVPSAAGDSSRTLALHRRALQVALEEAARLDRIDREARPKTDTVSRLDRVRQEYATMADRFTGATPLSPYSVEEPSDDNEDAPLSQQQQQQHVESDDGESSECYFVPQEPIVAPSPWDKAIPDVNEGDGLAPTTRVTHADNEGDADEAADLVEHRQGGGQRVAGLPSANLREKGAPPADPSIWPPTWRVPPPQSKRKGTPAPGAQRNHFQRASGLLEETAPCATDDADADRIRTLVERYAGSALHDLSPADVAAVRAQAARRSHLPLEWIEDEIFEEMEGRSAPKDGPTERRRAFERSVKEGVAGGHPSAVARQAAVKARRAPARKVRQWYDTSPPSWATPSIGAPRLPVEASMKRFPQSESRASYGSFSRKHHR
jgi:hypothetical protein